MRVRRLVDRRKDPDYEQVTGHVKKDLSRDFKAYCTKTRITIAEALEEAIQLWLTKKTQETEKTNEQPKQTSQLS